MEESCEVTRLTLKFNIGLLNRILIVSFFSADKYLFSVKYGNTFTI